MVRLPLAVDGAIALDEVVGEGACEHAAGSNIGDLLGQHVPSRSMVPLACLCGNVLMRRHAEEGA